MASRRSWQSLSPAYRRRLERGGITAATYGKVSASAARGHARTPERPSRAAKNPLRYPQYIAKRPGFKPVTRRQFDKVFERIDPLEQLSRDDYWNAMPPIVRRQWVDWQDAAHNAYIDAGGETAPGYITQSWEIMTDVEHPEWDERLFWYH